MKLISWNVGGFRAALKKGFSDFFDSSDADIFCLQEVKALEHEIDFKRDNYFSYLNHAEKKGYSGVMVYTKIKPLNVTHGIGIDIHDTEGRVITLEYNEFYLVNVYTPNSKRELARLDYRMIWETEFLHYVKTLELDKPVIICGDLNVAHKEIDLKNPKSNKRNAGFTIEERDKMSELLNNGFIDTFRYFHPNLENKYSWWSYMGKARINNVGWRIDYFLVSESLKDKLISADIYDEIMGSDHCPVQLQINL